MSYVRNRRLAIAVHQLQGNCQSSILDIALQVGFGSQQGFSRTFKQVFGLPPGMYRNRKFPLPIQERMTMSPNLQYRLPGKPEFRHREASIVAGLAMDFNEKTRPKIPKLWQRFSPYIGNVPGQLDFTTYGVCLNMRKGPEHFRYIAAVAVSDEEAALEFAQQSEAVDKWQVCQLPALEYAVFTHQGSLDYLQETIGYIFGTWLPESGHELADSPDFELYDERFNPQSRDGSLQIWLPIK